MFSTPTPDALIACEQVTKLPRWTEIDKMIEAEIACVMDRLLGANEVSKLHELRGRAMALKEFQQTVRDARRKLEQMGVTAPIS